jgi:hypothetical protein
VIFSDTGEVVFEAKVPDTITSWVSSAFAINDQSGLGVAPTVAKLKVFRPFFVRLELPYSVRRTEKFALQVLVFNYMDHEQDVRLYSFLPFSYSTFIMGNFSGHRNFEASNWPRRSWNRIRIPPKGRFHSEEEVCTYLKTFVVLKFQPLSRFSKQEKGYNVRYVSVPGGGVSKAVYFPIMPTEGCISIFS